VWFFPLLNEKAELLPVAPKKIAMRIGRGSTVEIGDWILFDSGDISPL
jgi:hypothetical protein